MDIKYFADLWIVEDNNKEAIENFWNNKAKEFNKITNEEKSINKLVDFLYSNNIFYEDSKILDIGCGPGKYSIEFAKKCKEVVALDISDEMLKFADENAKENKVENIDFKKVFWDEVDLKDSGFEKEFDLVFASMCPGVNSYGTLMKMMQASKKHCFISSFVERKNLLWDELNKFLEEKTEKSYDKKIYCTMNILYLMGYYPQIKYIDRSWDKSYTVDYLAKEYILRLEMKEKLNEEKKEKIYDYLNSISDNGYVRECVKSKIAWLYWSID